MSLCIPLPPSRALLHITVSILCFLGVATSRPTQNITIEVPNGTTSHGKPDLLCPPPTWSDIASYLLLNYVAHGATVVSYPGEPAFDTFLCVVSAILFPTFGVVRAFNFIVRHPVLTAKNDLEMAARSGALCMLVRSPSWKPLMGDNIKNALIKDPDTERSPRGGSASRSDSDPKTIISPTYVPTYSYTRPINSRMYFLLYQRTATMSIYKPPWLSDKTLFWSYADTDLDGIGSRRVFGLSEPPDQYRFAFVPRNAVVLGLVDSTPTPSSSFPDIPSLHRNFTPPVSTPTLSSSFNLVKGMVALFQSLYASFTLIRTDGGQVKRYGYAAPSLTVLPYALMSTLNLMANLVAPNYPTLYLVRSEVMKEAERRLGKDLRFEYVVGEVVDESGANNIAMEGWSEIAGSFKVDDKLLSVSPSAEELEDEKIEICDSSHQIIYVPSCPRFKRTDDSQTSPLRQLIETRQGPVYSRHQYMVQCLQAVTQSSLWYDPRLLASNYSAVHVREIAEEDAESSRMRSNSTQVDLHELFVIVIICVAELIATLVLSKFNAQQSTVAQRAWTITWLLVGSLGGGISLPFNESRLEACWFIFVWGAPAIGGFVVVCQILKAYGICHKTV